MGVIVLFSLLVVGCMPARVPTTPDKPGTYSVNVVVNFEGEGMEGVAFGVEGLAEASSLLTDKEGKLTIAGLTGEHKITPAKEGYSFNPPNRTVTQAEAGGTQYFLAYIGDPPEEDEAEFPIGGKVHGDLSDAGIYLVVRVYNDQGVPESEALWGFVDKTTGEWGVPDPDDQYGSELGLRDLLDGDPFVAVLEGYKTESCNVTPNKFLFNPSKHNPQEINFDIECS